MSHLMSPTKQAKPMATTVYDYDSGNIIDEKSDWIVTIRKLSIKIHKYIHTCIQYIHTYMYTCIYPYIHK